MIIDLHGLTEAEALLEIDSALWEFDESHEDTLEIITGNGIVLKGVVIDYLNQGDYAWEQPSYNRGTVIVYKK